MKKTMKKTRDPLAIRVERRLNAGLARYFSNQSNGGPRRRARSSSPTTKKPEVVVVPGQLEWWAERDAVETETNPAKGEGQ